MNQVVEYLGGAFFFLGGGGATEAVEAAAEAASWWMERIDGLVASVLEFPRFPAVVSKEAEEIRSALTAGESNPWLTP